MCELFSRAKGQHVGQIQAFEMKPEREAGSSQEVRTPVKQRGGAPGGATWLPQQSWQGENIKKENALRGKEG